MATMRTFLIAFIFVLNALRAENEDEILEDFYLLKNRTEQTYDFVQKQKEKLLPPHRFKLSIWEAVRLVDTLSDESDSNRKHLPSSYFFRTAEALRKDNQPRWLILTGLIYDLGKVLTFFGEPSWAVYGETFPLGCAFSELISFNSSFRFNPDKHISRYQMVLGIYQPHCGLANVQMSWSQDEYLYHVVKDYIPEKAAFIIRYRSFKALQRGGYSYLLSSRDHEMLRWLNLFKRYENDVSNIEVDWTSVKTYYEELVAEFFPPILTW